MSKSPADIFSIGATLADGSALVIHLSGAKNTKNPLAISCTHVAPIANAPAGKPQAMVRLYGRHTGKFLGSHAVLESADTICGLFAAAKASQPVSAQPIGRAEAMFKKVVKGCGLAL